MLFTKIFWGSLIVLFGLSIIINSVFKINFPFFKVFIALIIIFFGFKLLFGSFGINSQNSGGESSTVFSASKIHITELDENMEYNAVFGSQLIDFRGALITKESEIEINAVFGSVKVYLPENAQIKLKASSAFGSVRTPNGEMVSFGDSKKTISNGDADKVIYIEANAVFGSVDFR